MPAVYAATHRNQKQFAVKVLHPELSLRENIRARFLREGYAANSVRHAGRGGYLTDQREAPRSLRYPRAPMLEAVLVLAATAGEVFRPRCALLAEIALLRHQLAVLQRSVARPRVTRFDRIALVALAAVTPTWRNVLRIVQPETLLRRHRAGFRALWRWRSRTRPARRLDPKTAALVRSMAAANRLWGAERIRGELLKLGIKVSKRTVQRYMRAAQPRGPRGQRWSTFLRNHAHETWACDFLQAYDVFFRPIFAFVFLELSTRRVMHAATTRFPSQAWVTQQLRNATPFGAAPRFLIRDRDNKFGKALDALARATGIRIVHTAVRAPNMNAVCERFLGSLRRECLDHVMVLDERHLQRVVAEYVRYYNAARPHQGNHQRTPVPSERPAEGEIVAFPVLGGLHHEYRTAA
jgi:transposase InsO family protein